MTATVWWRTILQAIVDHDAIVVGALALVGFVLIIVQSQKIKKLRLNLAEARREAEEAARAAALAHPGSIDPEAVIEVLRRGIPPTLDNVYSVMRRRDAIRDAEDREREAATAAEGRVTSSGLSRARRGSRSCRPLPRAG
ncbi:MAG: hypothetical protein JOZ75_04825 [Candidatus Dormibacteraeota bacterium]|nr:hypothetical protein [Candidatus Dormibacteraeota bacterium]